LFYRFLSMNSFLVASIKRFVQMLATHTYIVYNQVYDSCNSIYLFCSTNYNFVSTKIYKHFNLFAFKFFCHLHKNNLAIYI